MSKIKYPEDFKKFVRKCAQDYGWYLKIQHFKVDIFFNKTDCKDDEIGSGKRTAASINVDVRYLKATIDIYPRLLDDWKLGSKNEVAESISHEMAHIITQPLFDLTQTTYKTVTETKNEWEALTERIGRLTHKLAALDMKKR